ncbi:hypothetical protein BJ508DRAFT_335575 [Ascobolus immersus RN42]|uniref:Uncharacterized protein n=1 Tax=Ascobolus immersus RN42 TaxID=1160509 RepID=A0A3N4HBX2_ASCIM|nr:hypothetical protein BJ508DRAFT_335575 [Ascobolus immersus RN42]
MPPITLRVTKAVAGRGGKGRAKVGSVARLSKRSWFAGKASNGKKDGKTERGREGVKEGEVVEPTYTAHSGPVARADNSGIDDPTSENYETRAVKNDPFVQLGIATEKFCQSLTAHAGSVMVTKSGGMPGSGCGIGVRVGDEVVFSKKVTSANQGCGGASNAVVIAEMFDMEEEVYDEVGRCLGGGVGTLMRLLPVHMVRGSIVEVKESGAFLVEWEASRRCGPFV